MIHIPDNRNVKPEKKLFNTENRSQILLKEKDKL